VTGRHFGRKPSSVDEDNLLNRLASEDVHLEG